MNNLIFHKVEIDPVKIESFIRESFESKLGKSNVVNTQLFVYPNEFIVAVTILQKNSEAQKIAHELQEFLLDNNLTVGVYTKEAQVNKTNESV